MIRTSIIKISSTVRLAACLVAAVCLALPAARAQTAEVKVLGFLSLRPILAELAPAFERATGHRMALDYDSVNSMRSRIAGGETADVMIASRSVLDDLARLDRVAAGSITDMARISIRLFVRAGAPKPDISSVAALKHALLTADSIAFTDPARGALAGRAFADALNRLGIADELKSKSKSIQGLGSEVVAAVAAGAAAIGAAPTNDLTPLPGGIEIVGPLPQELATDVVISAGIVANARMPEAATALIKFLASRAATPAIRAHGMER
jgi:molybdate transport system substrate-binding protein